ncbi:hypothetical protein BOTNAR_0074g00240 [Botryotinia narcissicola]|uniref:PH domain-containing protein n=1 Tax=Botryotinia narcissicola TaxID=278944 RepID=A0A4Z1IWU3_9HELO|nr:hypothetical protein BOTNAR_0074g00240 [Botryotinia narcissicola]
MGRNRVMSFMSQFRDRDSNIPTRPPPSTGRARSRTESYTQQGSQDTGKSSSLREPFPTSSFQMSSHQESPSSEVRASPQPTRTRERASSRPTSMAQTFLPPLMDVNQDTLPELQPIFTFLNSHSNKLYQEGYFLKLDDQNIHGKANADRTWTDCFAQLVVTILSLWDAAELDAAGQDGEVLPKFINLTDASIKMIESLPTMSPTEAPLQNVLSISTAGKNRYLLHFNSHHSLVQWTAGIRLCMFEHASLQEAYTGALIAGKDWARVRFGAGTSWRRCWCVITPPDEKEVQRLQKQSQKKRSAYDRSRPPILKGDIKFYDSKRTKKVRPIATINDAYSAFAIYPQSKPLIDASTLVKVEGSITIHSNPPLTSEGFVFVMPEVHPAVSGFEMMLRWLFPVYDTFGLYGRPGRLVAETNDTRSLLFAMPEHRRYGYLETLDVSSLISEQGSANWLESEWRGRMKDLTAKRMVTLRNNSQRNSQYGSRRSRHSVGNPRTRLQFDDAASSGDVGYGGLPRTDSALVAFQQPKTSWLPHQRSISESQPPSRDQNQNPSVFDGAYEPATIPPLHSGPGLKFVQDAAPSPDRLSSEDEQAASATPVRELQELQTVTMPEPVAAPPAFKHAPGAKPPSKPLQSTDLRKANNRMSTATLSQLTGAAGAAATYHQSQERRGLNAQTHDRIEEDEDQGRGVLSDVTRSHHMPANHNIINEGIVATYEPRNEQESTLPSNRDQIQYQNQYYQSDHTNFNSQSQSNFLNDMLPPKNPSSQPSRLQTSQSISRKPLPTREEDQSSPTSSHPPSSSGSLTQHILDSGAFDLILPKADDFKLPQMNRHNSDLSSAYDDAASTGTPDYASTKKSVRSSVEKPRAGKKKIIGNIEVGQPLYGDENTLSKGVDIDFGPTFDLNRAPGQDSPSPPPKQNNFNQSSPEKRPSHERSPSGNALAWQPGMSATAANNTFGHKQGLTAEEYVQQRSMVAAATPQYIHQLQPSGNILRATSPTPARATPSPTPGRYTPSPTPGQTSKRSSALIGQHSRHSSADLLNLGEGYGQNRHSRHSSADLLNFNEGHGQNRNSRRNSTDLLNSAEVYGQQQHARHSSADLLRPSSRGANRVLGPSGNGTLSTNLSAREQAFVAKMTGGPLIAMAKNTNKDKVVSAGLVGAIGSREKEKQHFAVPSKRGSWMGPNFPQAAAWTTPAQLAGQYQPTLAHSPGQYQTTMAHSPGQYQPTLAHSPGQYQTTMAHSPGQHIGPLTWSVSNNYGSFTWTTSNNIGPLTWTISTNLSTLSWISSFPSSIFSTTAIFPSISTNARRTEELWILWIG